MNIKQKTVISAPIVFCLLLIISLTTGPVFSQTDSSISKLNKLGKNGKILKEPIFNGSFFFYEGGKSNKTSLILVHGIGDEASLIWKSVIPVLEKKYHVITFDLPGFGSSEKNSSHYSPKNYARFIKWVADKHAQRPLYVAGHSMGGAISLYFAGTYRKDLDRLILIDVAGILHRTVFTKTKIKLGSKSSSSIFRKPLNAINRWLGYTVESIDKNIMPQNLEQYLQNSFFRKNVVADKSAINAGISLISTNFSKQLYRIKSPTFLIWGEEDTIAPIRTAKILDSNIPLSKLYVMKNTKHNPMLEYPHKFRKRLLHCLQAPEPAENTIKSLSSRTNRTIELVGRNDQQFSGIFKTITIKDCQNITLKNIHAEEIRIDDSEINIEYSTVTSKGIAISASNSVINMTGVTVKGSKAISSYFSNFDMAGVTLKGRVVALESKYKTRVLFSVSRILSPQNNRFIHETKILYKGDSY